MAPALAEEFAKKEELLRACKKALDIIRMCFFFSAHEEIFQKTLWKYFIVIIYQSYGRFP